MEEKRIKLPKQYSQMKIRSFSNKNIHSKDSNNKEKTKCEKTINENNIITTASDSTFYTNKIKNKSINFIYKKNVSRAKGKVYLSKNKNLNSSRKKISNNSKFNNLLSPIPNFPKFKEINNSFNLFGKRKNRISYNNMKVKIHGNKEIQDKIKCHTIKNANNIAIIFNNNNIYNLKQSNNNCFINIEDLMLLEEKFNDVLNSIKIKSNIANECFEFINFYNQSSLFNRFENYFRDKNEKIIAHNSLILIIFNIIFIYHLSFDNASFNSTCNYLMKIIKMNYNSYLLLCSYISYKISSKEKGNIWVKKLKAMIQENLTHLGLDNEDYINFLFSKSCKLKNNVDDSFTNSFNELKYYTHLIEKYIKIILNFLDIEKLKIDFLKKFQNLENTSIDELSTFFFSKILRIINKNASIEGNALLYENELRKEDKDIKIPYLNIPSNKKFTLILDLDETLIFFQKVPTKENKGILKFRPGLDKFLKNVKKYYEIIVFTSATKEYADPIENEIENKIKYFDYRLYRQHTIIYNNYFVKDISRIGRSLDKIVIIDNMPQNFKLQKENGIMIKPYWGEDKYDSALFSLEDILIKIACNFDDVRKGISFYKDDILNKVSSNFSKKEIKL